MTTMPDHKSLALIDALKAGACCLIVLHHLAFYGPMADHADDLYPALFEWLAQHARLAVQVFLVLGGYLAAKGLMASWGDAAPAQAGVVWRDAGRRVVERFFRLALPLWAALVLAVLCNAVSDHWMDHPSISAAPNVLQLLTHLLLLQDIAGHEALSAGIWYVAIDFQLFAMLTLMGAVARLAPQPRGVLMGLTLAALSLSALFINRHPSWDVGAPYFWCSYGLGVALGLSPRRRELGLAALVVMGAFLLEPRSRLLVAITTAVVFWAWMAAQGRVLPRVAPWCRGLSRISYSVFLTHFPVCLVVNAIWVTFLPVNPWVQLWGVVTALKVSLLAGWLFHERVERPLVKRVSGRVSGQAATHPAGLST